MTRCLFGFMAFGAAVAAIGALVDKTDAIGVGSGIGALALVSLACRAFWQ